MNTIKEENPYPKQILGGFYLKARKIDLSEIAHVAPSIREVWDWILRQCNHKEYQGIKRGQCVRRIADIQEGLFWMVGYRKMMYSKTQCEHALEFLRKKQMITTSKTTRGLIITVCNYDSYQDVKNYEYNTEGNNKTTVRQQQGDTIYKNDNKEKNENRVAVDFQDLGLNEAWREWEQYRKEKKNTLTPTAIKKQSDFLKKYPPLTAIEIINNSILKGWSGLFEPKETKDEAAPIKKMVL